MKICRQSVSRAEKRKGEMGEEEKGREKGNGRGKEGEEGVQSYNERNVCTGPPNLCHLTKVHKPGTPSVSGQSPTLSKPPEE